jgi:hypothetical protein
MGNGPNKPIANFDELYPPDSGAPAWPNVPGTPPTVPSEPSPSYGDYATDLAKSAAISGPAQAVTGLIGMPRTLTGAADSINDYFASLLGKPADQIAADRAKANAGSIKGAILSLPSPQDVQSAIESKTGPIYQPKYLPGQYAAAVTSALTTAPLGPGTLPAKVLNAVGSGLGSEALGQYFKGYGIEPVMRVLGGIGGGLLGAKGLTPAAAASPEHAASVAVLDKAGIPLSAGDRTGSRLIRTIESSAADMPFSAGAAQDAAKAQGKAINQYFTEQPFDPAKLTAPSSTLPALPAGATLPAQNVMAKGAETLADEYNRIHNANALDSTLPLPAGGTVGSRLQNNLLGHESTYYNQGLPTGKSPALANARNDIIDALVAGQGKVSGAKYQGMRSDLGDIERSAYSGQTPDTALGAAAKGMKQSLDEAYAASLPPGEAAALATNNRRYALMKQLTAAVNAGGEYMSPAQIAGAMRSGRAVPYSQGAGQMDEVARAAQDVLKPLPNSMTAARTGWQNLFNVAPWLLSAGAAGAAHQGGLGLPAIIGGAVAPHLLGSAIVSRPGQAWLGNTILPQRSRDVITQALINQGVTQPATSAQNDAEIAAFNAKRDQHLRDIGLAPGGVPSGFSQ